MNRRSAVQAMAGVAAAAMAVRPARAASSEVDTYVRRWNRAKTFAIAIAEAMPADGYTFKATPEVRPWGQLMVHLANANLNYFRRIKGEAAPLKPPAEPDKDKEGCKKFLSDSFDWCAGVLGGMSAEDLDKSYPGQGKQPALTGRDLVINGFIHTAHTRGYADVYLRVKGLTPPPYEV
jgi:hypothetical protein